MSALAAAGTYVDRTCVLRLEVNDGLTTAGNLNLVLRAETRHHYNSPPSVTRVLPCVCYSRRSVPLMVLLLHCRISLMLIAHRILGNDVRHTCEALQSLGPTASVYLRLWVRGRNGRCKPSGMCCCGAVVVLSRLVGSWRVVGESNYPRRRLGENKSKRPRNASTGSLEAADGAH